MEMLAVGDVVWQALIAAVVTVFLGWMNVRASSEARRDALKKDIKLEAIAKVGEATYTFQNHAMGLQKKALAVACRSKAEITNNEVDIAEAVAAERDYTDHQKGQAKVDAQALISRAEEQARKVLQESAEQRKTAFGEHGGDGHEIEGTLKGTIELNQKNEES